MPASTFLDVMTGSLTAIGQLGFGQTASAEDQALFLRLVNLLLSKISTTRLMLFNVATREYTLTPSVADYTVGPSGATFTAARPTFIESAQVQQVNGGPWMPLSVLDKPKWDAIRTKDAIASVCNDLWPEYTYPNLTFHVNPAPSGAPKVRLGAWEPLTPFASVFDPVSFPQAYEEYLESTLAIMGAPYYDQPVPQGLRDRQAAAELAVMKINAQGMGGSLGEAQTLTGPNLGSPIPSAPVGAPQ